MTSRDIDDHNRRGVAFQSANPDSGSYRGDDADSRIVRFTVEAIRKGDHEAFRHLVELYQRRLFALTLMMVRDRSAAEEVTQDAFVGAFTHLDRYDVLRPFYPWLATIAVRHAQTWLRSHARSASREMTQQPEAEQLADDADPLGDLVTDESGRKLWESVEALPSGERTAVFLYYRQEMKVREIAHALGVTNGTVKTLLFRARQKLRQAFEHEERNDREGPQK